MQKLHLVGFTATFDGLIFSTRKGAKSGNFVVPLDGRLLKQIAEAERTRDGRGDDRRSGAPRLVRPESSLSPREMQERIRSGWTVDEVATEAGVDLDWVRRFAAPVLAEVRRVIEQARDAVYDKPRFGLSTLPLGSSVLRNVLDRGVRLLDEEFDEAWSAYQVDEQLWVVRFTYLSRGRPQSAEWLYDLDTEELSSRNRLGAQLAHVARGRARRTTPAVATPARGRRAATKPAPAKAVKTTAKKAAKKTVKKSATKAAKKTVRKVPAPRRPAPATRATTRTTKAAPGRVARPAKATRPAPRTAARRAAPPRKKAATRPAKKPAKETAPVALRPEPVPAAVAVPEPEPAPAPARPTIVFDDLAPPRPGAVEVDPETGIARIDSRRHWHAPPVGTEAPRPRRTEPLRAR